MGNYLQKQTFLIQTGSLMCFYNNSIMKNLLKLFDCQFESYLDPKKDIVPQLYPTKLIKQLNPNNPRNYIPYFLKVMCSEGKRQYSTKNLLSINKQRNPKTPIKKIMIQPNKPFNKNSIVLKQTLQNKKNVMNKTISWQQMMQRITLIALLLLHTNNLYSIIENILPLQLNYIQKDQWMFTTFLLPAQDFLLKCCSSQQLFTIIKSIQQEDEPQKSYKNLQKKIHYDFETAFYIINLLKKLHICVKKCSLLGRYQGVTPVTNNFVITFSYFSVKLYDALKKIIQQMINNPSLYLPTRKEEKIIKFILKDELPLINQQIKTVVLNKYFIPYKKGYKTRLFRNEDQCEQTAKVINGIINSHRDTARQTKMKKYEESLMEYSIMRYNQSLLSKSRQKNNTIIQSDFSLHIQEFSINSINTNVSFYNLQSSQSVTKKQLNLDNSIAHNLQCSHSSINSTRQYTSATNQFTDINILRKNIQQFEIKQQQYQKDIIKENTVDKKEKFVQQ